MSDRGSLAVALIVAAACMSPPAERVAGLPLEPPVTPALSFRANGDAFEARHATHATSMDKDGRVQVVPASAHAAFSLKLESVQRGARRWVLRAPERREVDGAGALLAHWPHGVDETWVNEARGLEQKLVLQRPPPGRGDVVVHLSARGLDYAGAVPGGHRFEDPASGAAVSYQEAFALVSGVQRALEVRRMRDGLDLVVPDALVREASWPLVIDPLIDVDTPALISPPGLQTKPKIAWTGSGYMTAWVDARGTTPQVYYARVTDLTKAPPFGQPLTNATFGVSASDLALACDAQGGCLFAWTANNPQQVMATYVIKDKLPSPTSGTPLAASAQGTSLNPAVAASPNGQFFVAWVDGSKLVNAGWLAPMVSMTPTPIPLPPTTGNPQSAPAVASGRPYEAVLAWQELNVTLHYSVFYAVVSGNQVAGPLFSADSRAPAVAWSGTEYHVAWQQQTTTQAIFGTRFAVLDGGMGNISFPGLLFDSPTDDDVAPALAMAYPSGGYGVELTWTRGATVDSAAWSSTGSGPLPAVDVVSIPEQQLSSSVACSASDFGCLAIWEATVGVFEDIRGSMIQPSPQTADSLISVAANDELRPAIAASRSQYLVAWSDSRGDQGLDIWGALLTPAAATTMVFSLAQAPGDDDHVDVASNGDSFAVVWTNASASSVMAVEYGSTGQPLSGQVVVALGAVDWPAIAWNGQTFVTVFQATGAMSSEILATSLNFDGGSGSPAVLVEGTMGTPQGAPALAANLYMSLVAWGRPGTANGELRLMRLDPNLAPQDPMSVGVPGSTMQPGAVPAVATDGANFLVAWVDVNSNVRATRVTVGGGIIDVGGIVIGVGQPRLSAGFDGTNWVILWRSASNAEDAPIQWTLMGPAGASTTPILDGASEDIAFMADGSAVMTAQHFDPSVQARRVGVTQFAQSADGGSSHDAGSVSSDGGTTFAILCEANDAGTVGVPYVYNAQGRILTNPMVQATYSACSNQAGFEVDALTGAVSWVPDGAGTYSFCVEATPLKGEPAQCNFTVTVSSTVTVPGPDAGIEIGGANVSVGQPVHAVATTPSATVVQYRWDFGDMSPLVFGPVASHSYDLPGSYQVELTVIDRWGRAASAKSPVRVVDSQGHAPPVARIDVAPGSAPQTFAFQCSSCASGLKLVWELGDQFQTGTTASRAFMPGRQRVRLRALDPATGLVGHDQVMIRVDDPRLGAPPDCHAWVNPRAAVAPGPFTFFVDGVFDTSGGIQREVYTFSDGGQVALANIQPLPVAPGTERGVLRVEAVSGLVCIDDARAVALGGASADLPPRFEAIPQQTLMCGATYDFTPLVEGTRPLTFTGSLPSGVKLDPSTGELTGMVPSTTEGMFPVQLHVTNDAGMDDVMFTVKVDCSSRGVLDFQTRACGCGAVGGAPALLLALVRLLRRRR
jgi:hypothetical protein